MRRERLEECGKGETKRGGRGRGMERAGGEGGDKGYGWLCLYGGRGAKRLEGRGGHRDGLWGNNRTRCDGSKEELSKEGPGGGEGGSTNDRGAGGAEIIGNKTGDKGGGEDRRQRTEGDVSTMRMVRESAKNMRGARGRGRGREEAGKDVGRERRGNDGRMEELRGGEGAGREGPTWTVRFVSMISPPLTVYPPLLPATLADPSSWIHELRTPALTRYGLCL